MASPRKKFSSHISEFELTSKPQENKKKDEDEEDKIDNIESFRLILKKYLSLSLFGRIYSVSLVFISIVSCVEYIYESYLDENDPVDAVRINYLHIIEMFFAGIFLFDWMLMLFIADHKSEFFGSFFSMIDILTIIPTFSTYGTRCPLPEDLDSSYSQFIYTMNIFSTTRILRILRMQRYLILVEDPVHRYLGKMILIIFSMLIFDSCLMMFLERPDQTLKFHEWIYYTWVTVTTVGYGDISPITTRGRFFFMCLIGFSIVILPMLTNELFDILKSTSIYSRHRYKVKKLSSHVLICGQLQSCSLREFFAELFHEDHESLNLHAVVLQPIPPNFEMLSILEDNIFSMCVTYLEGSPLIEKDLRRAVAEKAIAVFLLTNKFASNPDYEDANIIIQQLSITRYAQLNSNGFTPPFCKQLIKPENRKHISSDYKELDDLVLCVNEIKMGMLAKSALFSGTNTLILNLISSFTDEDEEATGDDRDEHKNAKKDMGIDVLDDDNESEAWMNEYKHGCGWEIYTTIISQSFAGAKFSVLSNLLYQKLGIILFGLQISDIYYTRKRRIILNPGDYIIPTSDEYFVEGLVIAENKTSSDLSMSAAEGDYVSSSRLEQLSLITRALQKNSKLEINHQYISSNRSSRSNNIIHERKRSNFMYVDMDEIQSKIEKLNSQQSLSPSSSSSPSSSGNANTISPSKSYDSEGEKEKAKDKYEWQKLIGPGKVENDGVTDSANEIYQKKEEQHLKKYYFVRRPIYLSTVTIKTSVTEELPTMNDYIVIIGKDLSNLYDLIKPLRARYLGKLSLIVILSQDEIPNSVWQRISMFEGIVFVRGSPIEMSDLRRAGIYRAKQVIVLANSKAVDELGHNGVNTEGANRSLEALADVDVIFTFQCVRKMNERANIIIEIVHTNNISYLDFEERQVKNNYKFSPQFASGMLFPTSLLDTLVCQSLYSPNIIQVVNELLGGVDSSHHDNANPTKNSNKPKPKNTKDQNQTNLKRIIGSCIYQIPVPDDAENKTFGYMYKFLSQRDNIIPIAVLRGTFPHMKIGPKGNKMPYVFTNPDKDTELFTCDRLFVLSQKPLTTTKLKTLLEASKDIRTYEESQRNIVKEKIKTEFYKEFEPLSIKKKMMEDAFKSLERKSDNLFKMISDNLDTLSFPNKFESENNIFSSSSSSRGITAAKQSSKSKPTTSQRNLRPQTAKSIRGISTPSSSPSRPAEVKARARSVDSHLQKKATGAK